LNYKSVGNQDKQQTVGTCEKSLISFSVDNVDETYAALKAKGVAFIIEPTDMPDWGMRNRTPAGPGRKSYIALLPFSTGTIQ